MMNSFPETNTNTKSEQSDSTTLPVTDPESAGTDPIRREDQALALLRQQDLPGESIEQLAKNATVMKSRKARIAIAAHPRTPRHISLRLVREFYTFDLMRYALLPAVAADLKRAADEMLIKRIASITLGERISLARRASTVVAAALLLDKETRVWQTALENSRLTEAAVVRTLLNSAVTPKLVDAVCHHPKWSLRHEIRIALLRNKKTPLARAVEFARTLPPAHLRDILHTSNLPEKVKSHLKRELLEARR